MSHVELGKSGKHAAAGGVGRADVDQHVIGEAFSESNEFYGCVVGVVGHRDPSGGLSPAHQERQGPVQAGVILPQSGCDGLVGEREGSEGLTDDLGARDQARRWAAVRLRSSRSRSRLNRPGRGSGHCPDLGRRVGSDPSRSSPWVADDVIPL